jgi:hypothetical protein
MSNNKWTKTATSASLAILGVTQLNNQADAKIVLGGSNVTQSGVGGSVWTLDALAGYSAQADVLIFTQSLRTFYGSVTNMAGRGFFAPGLVTGSSVNGNLSWNSHILLAIGFSGLPAESGYFGFRDTKGGTPIYGWAKWTTTTSNTLTLNEWYYNDTPGTSIVVGDKGSSTAVPFDFNPLQGAALGVPIFIGLRQLKRRKAKLNTMVSVKGKEKIHPLALIGMGAAGVLKWRAQKDKDAA